MGVVSKLKRTPPVRKSKFELARDKAQDTARSRPAVIGAAIAGAGAIAYFVKKLISRGKDIGVTTSGEAPATQAASGFPVQQTSTPPPATPEPVSGKGANGTTA